MAERKSCDKVKSAIEEALRVLEGEQIDICYHIYKLISSVEGKEPELLRFFYENSEMIESSDEERVEVMFSEGERRSLEECYGKMVNGLLEATLRKKLPVEEFYQALWKAIAENPVLEDEKEKVFAVYYIWIDVRIPYFELEQGIKMSNADFMEITKKRLEDIKRIRFIMTAPLEQKTERASLLLKMLEGVPDEKERTVLMAQIMAISGRHTCSGEEEEADI